MAFDHYFLTPVSQFIIVIKSSSDRVVMCDLQYFITFTKKL